MTERNWTSLGRWDSISSTKSVGTCGSIETDWGGNGAPHWERTIFPSISVPPQGPCFVFLSLVTKKDSQNLYSGRNLKGHFVYPKPKKIFSPQQFLNPLHLANPFFTPLQDSDIEMVRQFTWFTCLPPMMIMSYLYLLSQSIFCPTPPITWRQGIYPTHWSSSMVFPNTTRLPVEHSSCPSIIPCHCQTNL